MTVFQRYLLIQIPGWILAVIILSALHRWMNLPVWVAVGLFAVYVGKDFVLYPFLRRAYEPGGKTILEQLVGEAGVATQQLDPDGYVRVRGELWHAEAAPGMQPVPQGSRIRVESARGMTLIVTPDRED